MSFKSKTVTFLLILVTIFTFVNGQAQTKAKVATQAKPKAVPKTGNATRVPMKWPLFVDEDRFCIPKARWSRPFYRSRLDGAICCRDQIVQAATITPEITGECAISTKTDPTGLLDSSPLWCAYTCSLKKLGFIDNNGMTKPLEFFNHLASGLGNKTKENLKLVMENQFNCMKPFKNTKLPCYTPLGFHKCFVDAMEYVCTNGMPKDNDFTKIPPSKNDYTNLDASCEANGKQVMPTCCHGKALPWTIADIMEVPRNVTAMKTCLVNMQHRLCSATCYMNSAGVVDDSMEVNVDAFSSQILGMFPTVQPSIWMNFLGPTYVFFDETLDEMSAGIPTEYRVCLFHDKILNFHEDKIQQYCQMTPQEVKEIKDDQVNV